MTESHHLSSIVKNDEYDTEENNFHHMRYPKDPPSSVITPNNGKEKSGELEALAYDKTSRSKENPQKPDRRIQNNGDTGAEIREDHLEENSIPSSICMSIGMQSNSS